LGAHEDVIGFVSGHGFSRAAPLRKEIGLQPGDGWVGQRTFFVTTKTNQRRPVLQSECNATLMIEVLGSHIAMDKLRLHDFAYLVNRNATLAKAP